MEHGTKATTEALQRVRSLLFHLLRATKSGIAERDKLKAAYRVVNDLADEWQREFGLRESKKSLENFDRDLTYKQRDKAEKL